VSHPPRVLVLRGGAIGDFILTLPALQAIRARWPGAYLELIGYPHIANLALAAGLAEHVDSLDRAEMARFFSPLPAFSDEQAAWLRSFDIVFSYLNDPGGVVRRNLQSAGARLVIYGSPIVESGHAIDHLLKPLESLAIYAEDRTPRLRLMASVAEEGRAWLAGRGLGPGAFVLHPGSGSPAKNWPVERFVEIARRLRERGREILVVSGEADVEVTAAFRRAMPDASFLEGRTLVGVAATLAACPHYLGNDSGITHLAAALGLSVCALFGPSRAERWGPRGERVVVVRSATEDIREIEIDEVWKTVKIGGAT
jgi:ADP-heptose:LPS heptosyltransferase